MRPGPENLTSDRMVTISEISEPNCPTLLGPSNQKSKLTLGGRLTAELKLKWPSHYYVAMQTTNLALKHAKISPFWRLFFGDADVKNTD